MPVVLVLIAVSVANAAPLKHDSPTLATSLLRRDAVVSQSQAAAANKEMDVTSTGQSLRHKEPPQRFQSRASGKQHIFVLTVPRSKEKTNKFLKAATDLGYVSDDVVTPIAGVDFESFYLPSSKDKVSALTQDQIVEKRQKALQQMFSKESESSSAAFPAGFKSSALLTLSPQQLAMYLSHRRFWQKAAQLPTNSWAVLFQDNVTLLGGPEILRGLLMQADNAAGSMTGGPARIVYLRGCQPGGDFMPSFLRDSSGYAIRAETAKELLSHAHGDLPVQDAMKAYTEGGLCAPIIKSEDHKQHPADDVAKNVKTFVLTFPRNIHQFNTFTWNAAAYGYFGQNAISKISAPDSQDYYAATPQFESTSDKQQVSLMKLQAKKKMLANFSSTTPEQNKNALPPSFTSAAEKSLSPRQLATYLGHIEFWRKASKMPKDSWAVLFEDDAQILTEPYHLGLFLRQAEAVADKIVGKPADLVYLKQCAHGKEFMDSFFPDARGYAIRSSMAQSLLSHAEGDLPVHEAIKKFSEGGLCAPVLKTEDKPRKISIMEEPLHMFVLSVPRNKERLKHWLENSTALGWSNKYSISQVKGIDFQKFVPAESQAQQNISATDGTKKDAEKAKDKEFENLFMEFVGNENTAESHSPMPKDFVDEAEHNLSPKELAIYLGHRRFWVEAAKLPKDGWAVLLQDDAQLLGGPLLLRSLLLQAELASKRLTQKPAQFVYLKKCESGEHFMDTFMNDAQGYAIRPDVALGLLRHAPGSRPVAEAIKQSMGGGLCAPVVRTESAPTTKKVHKLGWSSDTHDKDSDDQKYLAATPPNMDVGEVPHTSNGAERYKPRQLQIADALASDAVDGSVHAFVLTISRNKDRLSHFIQSSSNMGYTGSNSIEQINGTDFQQFYPTNLEMESLSLTEKQQAARKQQAVQEMFAAIATDSLLATSLSTDFMIGAAQHLSLGELATYLGHRKYWMRAAELPSNDWAVLLEDDADLLGGPGVMRDFLTKASSTAIKLHGGPAELVYLKPCPTGRSFMEYFMRDGMGYAIRAQTAKELLAHASGDMPVPKAIKDVTKGGICVPLIKNAETASSS